MTPSTRPFLMRRLLLTFCAFLFATGAYAQAVSIEQIGPNTLIGTTLPVSGTVTATSGTLANLKGTFTSVDSGGTSTTDLTAHAEKILAVDATGTAIAPTTLLTHGTTLGTITTVTGGMNMLRGASSTPSDVTDGSAAAPWADLKGRLHILVDTAPTTAVTLASSGVASGAYVAGSISDGADVTLGTKADAKNTATDTTAVSAMSVWKEISAMEQAPATRAVTNAGTFATQSAPTASATGGATPFYYIATANNNSTNKKASAGTVYSLLIINNTATEKFIRLYDSASAPTCTANTGAVFYAPIPANSTTGAGFSVAFPAGAAFVNGIGWCITGGAGDTDNTSTAAGDVVLNGTFK